MPALAAFEFPTGTLVFTEAGSTRRASLHLVRGAERVAAFDRGGLEVLETDEETFGTRLRSEPHTLKGALTDPRLAGSATPTPMRSCIAPGSRPSP